MILGRDFLTGRLVYSTLVCICGPCWNGQHRKCKVQADEFNKCECPIYELTKHEHARAQSREKQ